MPIDTQQLLLGTMIASLERHGDGVKAEERIFKGLALARKIQLDAQIASDLGTSELAVSDEVVNRVFSQPEWAAKKGTDKNFIVEGPVDSNANVNATYVVPGGKKLYISGFSFRIWAQDAADKDNNQIGNILLYADSTVIATLGGNGGNAASFLKPPIIEAGETFKYWISNQANHACNVTLTVWGYEI